MRYLVMHYNTAAADAAAVVGGPPDMALFAKMGKYMEEEKRAGVLLSAEGVHPSAQGARVSFAGGKRSVTDGPFTEAKEVIAGFAIIEAASLAEAVEAVSRFAAVFEPGPKPNIEIRRIVEMADFGHPAG